MPESPLVAIRGLAVSFDGGSALRGVDFTIAAGEAVGIVGESGCGKSVTWLASLGLLPASACVQGEALLEGEDLLRMPRRPLERVRGGRIAMIFQDPASALNPVQRVCQPVLEVLALHRGMHGVAARAEAKRLFERVGLPDPARRLDSYPHELSGGQNQRVMIAAALAGEPALLVADEPTTALDATVQAQILFLLDEVRRERGMALVLISHDLGVVSALCERIVVMYAGRIVEEAPTAELFAAPAHPYTAGLLAAMPPLVGRHRLGAIPGQVPEPWAMPRGCAFAPRCSRAAAECETIPPPLASVGEARRAACFRPLERTTHQAWEEVPA